MKIVISINSNKDRQAYIYDAKECFSDEFIEQKLNYIHKNPISGKWKLAETFIEYPHSSARFYEMAESLDGVEITHFKDILQNQ